jgi:protein-tyrosine phosphatase
VDVSYVDLHLHLLPGIDDGARSLSSALDHAARMAEDGVRDAAVTPHVAHTMFDVDVLELPERTAALQQAIDVAGIALRLHVGGELHPSGAAELTAEELDVVALGPDDSPWVLLEVPFSGINQQFLDAAAAVTAHGYGLVIAHPERAAGLRADGLRRLRPLLRAGALLQVNVCSLLGNNGPEALAAGEYLLRARLAYIIASDGHPGGRDHTIALGYELAREAGVSAVQAWQLTQANPRFLLQHGLPSLPPKDGRTAWRNGHSREVAAARRTATGR